MVDKINPGTSIFISYCQCMYTPGTSRTHTDSLSVSELQSLIKHGFNEILGSVHLNVVGTIGDISGSKFYYINLYEYEPNGNSRAKIKCCVFNTALFHDRLEEVGLTKQQAVGQEVLISCTPSYHELYGVSVVVQAVSTTFTRGSQAKQKEALINELKLSGLYDAQREVSVPRFHQHIIILGSPGTQGLEDFTSILDESDFAVQYEVVPVQFGADSAVVSVVQALETVKKRIDAGAICQSVRIVRGGGDKQQLQRLNTKEVCLPVASFPVPVAIAVGHTEDIAILDQIAAYSFKTPSDAAHAIVDQFEHTAAQVDQRSRATKRALGERTNQYATRIAVWNSTIKQSVANRMATYKRDVATWVEVILALSPDRIVEKGYVLMYDQQGTVIPSSSLQKLPSGSVVRLQGPDQSRTAVLD